MAYNQDNLFNSLKRGKTDNGNGLYFSGQLDPTNASELGIGSEYQSLLDANPYRNYNYHQSSWDSLIEHLGFRSGRQKYLDNLYLQANEYDSQIALKAQQEGYDSASAQAQRLREAGINPDLSGNVSAGDSSGVQPDNNPMAVGDSDDVVSFGGVVSTVVSAFSGAFGLVEKMQGMKAMKIANDQGQANILGTYMKQAEDYVMNAINEDDRWKPSSDNLVSIHHKLHIPRKYSRVFDDYLNSFYDGIKAQGNLETALKNWKSDRRSNALTDSSRYYDDAFDVLKGLNKELQDFYDDTTYKKAQNASTSEDIFAMSQIAQQEGIQNEYAYNKTYSGTKAANAQNELNDTSAANARLNRLQQAANRKIVSFLESKMNDGNIFAGAMLLIYNLLSSGGMSNIAKAFR